MQRIQIQNMCQAVHMYCFPTTKIISEVADLFTSNMEVDNLIYKTHDEIKSFYDSLSKCSIIEEVVPHFNKLSKKQKFAFSYILNHTQFYLQDEGIYEIELLENQNPFALLVEKINYVLSETKADMERFSIALAVDRIVGM